MEDALMDIRGHVQLAVLFVVGLAAGIWAFVAPWVIPYPTSNGSWTSSIWAATWVGAAVTIASALGLVAVAGAAAHEAVTVTPTAPPPGAPR
jgi:hypothetical protein